MNPIGIQLRISDLLFAVQKRWKIIVSLTFLGAVFGLLLSGMSYVQSSVQTYEVSGSVLFTAVNSSGLYSSNSKMPSKNDMTLAGDLYDTVYYLMRSDRLLYQVINEEEMLGISASDIRGGLSISRYYDTTVITVSLNWDNGEEGLELWNAIISTTNTLLPQVMDVGKLTIINEPEIKATGTKNTSMKTWLILPVLGFAAGMGFSVLEVLMHPTLINVKDVESVFGLETIGIIPYDAAHFRQNHSILIKDENTASDVVQNFSAAAYIIRNRIGNKEKNHCFYVTSTGAQEGRTSVAANVAIELSDMEKHVLLIDFDYKNPMLGNLFLNNLDYNRSINALYRGEITVTEAITTLTGYLDILPMVMEHNLVGMDNTIIDMITQLKEQYEYIIIDAPPVGKESITLSFNQVANTVLFVVRYDSASIPDIQNALQKLDKSGIRILGCIVNAYQTSASVMKGSAKSKKQAIADRAAKAKKKKKKKKQDTPDQKAELKENEKALLALTKQEKAKAGKESAAETGNAPAKPHLLPFDESEESVAEFKPLVIPSEEEKKAQAAEEAEEKPKKKRGLFGRKSNDAAPKEKKKAAKKEKPAKKRKGKEEVPSAEESAPAEDPFESALKAAALNKKSKNVFDDLLDDGYSIQESKSDEDMAEALLQMGLDGSWAESEENKKESEKPRAGKKNIFDDL